jgi:hypothetical protein
VVSNFIFRDDGALKQASIDFDFLLQMQDLGIISGVEALGLELSMKTTMAGSYIRLLQARTRGLLVTHGDESKELKVPIYSITSIGSQVLQLGTYEPDVQSLRRLGSWICPQGFEVSFVHCAPAGPGLSRYSGPEPLCDQGAAVPRTGAAA